MLPTKLILGTVQFGMSYGINNKTGKPLKNSVFEILDTAYENGINTLDTAEDYGDSQNVIGEYNVLNSQRGRFELISKLSSGILDPVHLAHNISVTLSTLNVPFLEGYLFHKYDSYSKSPAFLKELMGLKEKGLIRKIGVSIYGIEDLDKLIGDPHIDIIQLPYNLLDNHNHKQALLERLKAAGKEIHVRSVFLQGLFFMQGNNIPEKLILLRPYLLQVKQIAEGAGVSIEKLALQYVYRDPLVDKVLIGVDSKEQLLKSIEAIRDEVPNELFAEVDKITVKEKHLLYPINW